MKIIIGSINQGKISAVKTVFLRFFPLKTIEFISKNTASKVSNQPIGLNMVIDGAKNRAYSAMELFLQSYSQENPNKKIQEEIYAIGIEAGLVEIKGSISGYLDYQFCAILDSNLHISLGSGPGWEYPSNVVNALLQDRTLELADLMTQISGNKQIKYTSGAIGYYSQNKLTRPIVTESCIEMALIPHLKPELYFLK